MIMKNSLCLLALFAVSALLGASLYDTVVFGPNLQAGGAQGLEHGRQFMSAATPANLFRVLSPATQGILLIAAIASWKGPAPRWLLFAAFAQIVACDVITFTYAYPRLHVMFVSPLNTSAGELARAANEWVACNYVRVALIVLAWAWTVTAALRTYGATHRSGA